MTSTPSKYWFPAKRYGWGWGIPSTWQGWVVLGAFAVLFALGIIIFPPKTNTLLFPLYVAALTASLVGICYLKGEPPRWRSGKD
jgi:hypothetical protein